MPCLQGTLRERQRAETYRKWATRFSMGSQHLSPNVKTFCSFEPQIWLEIITSHDAKSACFKGSRTSCREINLGIFWPKFWPEKITSRDGCFLPILTLAVLMHPGPARVKTITGNICLKLSGLPNENAKSQRFSYASSQIATLPSVVAPNRSFKSQIAARYAASWHAIPQIALASCL